MLLSFGIVNAAQLWDSQCCSALGKVCAATLRQPTKLEGQLKDVVSIRQK